MDIKLLRLYRHFSKQKSESIWKITINAYAVFTIAEVIIDKIFVSQEQLSFIFLYRAEVNSGTIQILHKVILQNKLLENPNFRNNF